jgi:hypothetical protein
MKHRTTLHLTGGQTIQVWSTEPIDHAEAVCDRAVITYNGTWENNETFGIETGPNYYTHTVVIKYDNVAAAVDAR